MSMILQLFLLSLFKSFICKLQCKSIMGLGKIFNNLIIDLRNLQMLCCE